MPSGVFRRGVLFDDWNTAGIDTAGGRGYHMLSHFVQIGSRHVRPLERHPTTTCIWQGSGCPLARLWKARFAGDRLAAAAELLERYFVSHGPATIRDAAWWTKLPLKLLRQAAGLLPDSIEMLSSDEEH